MSRRIRDLQLHRRRIVSSAAHAQSKTRRAAGRTGIVRRRRAAAETVPSVADVARLITALRRGVLLEPRGRRAGVRGSDRVRSERVGLDSHRLAGLGSANLASSADRAVVVVAPLKLVDGTGTPTRVLALV